jgi:predicted phage tail protein
MKKLRQKYKSEKDKTQKSGNGKQKKWKFFDQMDRILANRHNITPVPVLDTMKESENIDDDTTFQNNLEDSCNFSYLI